MSRPKLSCDWERPRCTRPFTHKVTATKNPHSKTPTTHVSQYCAEHHQLILNMPPPPGWTITTSWNVNATKSPIDPQP